METRAHYILVGSFVLTVLIAVFLAILWLASAQFAHQFALYDIYFRGSVTGLGNGAAVRYNGIPVGRVVEIRLDPQNVERIRVRVEIESDVPIKTDAVASLELQGITGQAFVQISGGSNASPAIEPRTDKRFPIIPSKPSRLEEVVTNAPELFRKTTQVADRLAQVLSDDNLNELGQILKNLATVSGTLAARSNEVDQVMVEAAGAMKDLRGVAASADGLLGRLNDSVNARGGVGDKLTTTLDEFNLAAKNLNQMTSHLDTLIQDNRGALRDFSQRGLSQAEQLVVDTRTLVTELTRVVDQIERDPPRFFFGDRRQGYQPR